MNTFYLHCLLLVSLCYLCGGMCQELSPFTTLSTKMLEAGGGSCHYHDVTSAKLYVFGGGWFSGYTLSASIQCVDLQQVLLSDGTYRIVGVNGVQIVGYLPQETYGCGTLSQRVNDTDYLYLFDTFHNFIHRKAIDKLNMSTDAWESFSGNSGYRYGTFFKTESFVYSLGGGPDINRAPLSDPTSWQKVGEFSPIVHLTMALVHEKTVHLFGGSGDYGAGTPTKNIYRISFEDLDNLTMSWSKAEGELPFPISFAQAVITNKYAYIVGGYRAGALSSIFWANTSDLTSWSVMTTVLPYGVYGPNLVASGDSIICLSGFTTTGSISDEIHLSFVPDNSSTLSCQEKLASDRFVCGNQSSCLYQDKCVIIEPTIEPTNITANITTNITTLITCNGINQNDSSVCNGRGICNQTDTCICNMGYFGLNCNNFTCFEISHLNDSVCNGFGKCTSNNTCECDGNHHGPNCSLPKCFNIESTNASVCTGRGICTNVNNCSCFDGYAGMNCETVYFNVISNISSNHVEIYQGENLVLLLDTQPLIMENITFHVQSPYYNISSPFNLIFLNLSILTPGVYNFTIFGSTTSFKSFPSYFSVMIKNRPEYNVEIVERIENLGGNDLPQIIPRRTSHNIKTFITNVTFSTWNPVEKLGCYNNIECFIDYQYYFTVSNIIIARSESGSVKSKVSTLNTTTITFTTPIVIDSIVSLNNTSRIMSLSIIFMKGNYSILSETNYTLVDSPLFNNDYKQGTNRGVAIIDLFSFQSSEWIAPSQLLPLSYSYGFYHESLKKSIVISNEFSNTPNITIPLPYLSSKKLRIIQFVKDSLGNLYENEFIQVNVDPPTVSITDLLKASNLTKLQRSVLPYDLSESNENDLIEKFNSIVLDPKNPESSLYSIQILTQSSLSERVSDLVVNKIESFLGDVIEIYQKDIEQFGFVKSKLSKEGTQSTVSILSNILQDQLFSKVEESAEKLSKLIMTGIIPSVISNDKIPIEEYSESRISITSTSLTIPPQLDSSNSKFKNNAFNTSIIVKLSELTNSSVTTGLSSINYYSSETTFNQSNILSSVVDFKFFLNGKHVILDNLQTPITIEFPVLNSSLLDIYKFNRSSSKIKCAYWDEEAQLWSERGCRAVNWDSNLITCSCNHTTKFSTFIEFNAADTLDAKKVEYLTATYIAEIVYGSVFGIISVIILISLFLLRKKQPVSSRLLTPYLGMLALLIDSVLSAIIQKSILISFLQSTNSTLRWEEGPNVANIFGNIAMIISNTFILTAILSYVLQVIRFQLLKIIYAKMNDNNDNQTRLFKILKVLCSTYCFSILIVVSLVLNVMYWTLWVVLVRLNVIPSEVYTLIISISYTVIIFVYSVIISIVAICDFVNSLIKENSYNSLSAKRKSKLHESHQTLLNDDNKRASLWKKTIGKFVLQDGPLYFRTEMILYLICFIFLIIQQAIGLQNEKYRHENENESYLIFTNNDVIRIIFQILYQIVYILVFGGFACGTAIIYLIRKRNQISTDISEMQTITQDVYGKILFETFCEKEFSTENLYLFELLQSNKNYTSGKDFDGMQSFLETIHDLFIKSNSVYEVNISSNCKKQFVEIYKKLESDFNNSSEEIIKLRSQISQNFEQLQDQVEMNLEDTFSRFVLTDVYEVYTKRKQTKIEIGKQMNVELAETQH